MKQSLRVQIIGLLLLSVVLGVANNFRPSAHIDWVRAWTPFSELKNEAEPPAVVETASSDKANDIPRLVLENTGITEIGLSEAHDIFRYGADLVLWIDARSPELYAEGHVEGAELLHFYDQEAYMDQIRAKIEETGPEALVIYCKGKDCTDSHHLAEDLQTKLGLSNIFVYKDGFDDWYKAGYPIAGELAAQAAPVTVADDGDPNLASSIPERVLSNDSISEIDLEEARQIYKYAGDLTFWIDARSPELFQEGHIKGAQLLHFYDQTQYRETISAEIERAQPEALVIYCKGKDCTDSHHLAEDLMGVELGGRTYTNIFVYTGGFDDWFKAGLPVEGSAVTATTSETPREVAAEKPPGMYLEHVVRDLLPFIIGMVLLIGWRRWSNQATPVYLAAAIVGLFFIWAAWPKLQVPLEFAKNIWNYDIAPAGVINLSALFMPALELLCGLGLVTGFWRRGSGVLVSGLLVIFIAAVSYNVMRGHEFNCGCTTTTTFITDVYLPGWNDKVALILRDLGLLVMSLMAWRYRGGPATGVSP